MRIAPWNTRNILQLVDSLVRIAWGNLPAFEDTQNLSIGQGPEQPEQAGSPLSMGLDMRPLEVPPA